MISTVAISLSTVATFVLWAYFLFVFFLAYLTILVAEKNGRLAKAPVLVRIVCKATKLIAGVLDGAFNIVVGSLIFWELPERKRLLFTSRCEKWMKSDTWRGDVARWFCSSWMNMFEDNHCHN